MELQTIPIQQEVPRLESRPIPIVECETILDEEESSLPTILIPEGEISFSIVRRKRKTVDEQIQIVKHYLHGMTVVEVANLYSITSATVLRFIRIHRKDLEGLEEFKHVDLPRERVRKEDREAKWTKIPTYEDGELDCSEVRAFIHMHKRIYIRFT